MSPRTKRSTTQRRGPVCTRWEPTAQNQTQLNADAVPSVPARKRNAFDSAPDQQCGCPRGWGPA
eukprot:3599316-Rhodomonas_salina.1